MTSIRLVKTTARGVPVGDDHPNTRWPDSMVAKARALRAKGWTIRAIAGHLGGPHYTTVWRWLAGIDRKPPAKVVARLVHSE